MLPELGASYGVSSGAAAVSVTAYLLPFAALQVVSGTLGERWGGQRTVRVAYVGYTAASLLCAVAPTLAVFLGGRALQGAANAFTTPMLFAALASTVPPERLGRALGWFGSLQAAGQTSAPLIGGTELASAANSIGVVNALAAPCSARPPRNTASVGATAQSSEAAVYPT